MFLNIYEVNGVSMGKVTLSFTNHSGTICKPSYDDSAPDALEKLTKEKRGRDHDRNGIRIRLSCLR